MLHDANGRFKWECLDFAVGYFGVVEVEEFVDALTTLQAFEKKAPSNATQ